ncbi:SDR family oxidoreductase [Nocardioides sp. GY 10113]|uniref:SDR family NAD(P)-dependent oxidoreductase n=1 Tax=Nocardioides sp. GY 10113 TaxID=2569761 RepID=UPI0010A8AEA8|nr:SDR family oxidoreductase [Nocardioides sp. GY 10113]TIC81273.1 SDR family oxidoreductase [Nocardioides sp. GY 10113]
MPVALVTGGSAGLGRELVADLAADGWTVVTDGRRPDRLADLTASLPTPATPGPGRVVALPGDVTDADHRTALRDALAEAGALDLLVHNASTLGPTPLPPLAEVRIDDLQRVWRTNVGAPLVLTAELLPLLVASRGVLLSISSDAAVEHYPGWGLYGASKAGLDHVTLTFAAENPAITAYAVDPGDMRTAMQQAAFPGEDIGDRPLPATVVPRLRALLAQRPPSGRYRAVDIPAGAAPGEVA